MCSVLQDGLGHCFDLRQSLDAVGLCDGSRVSAVVQTPDMVATDTAFALWCVGDSGVVTWGNPTSGGETRFLLATLLATNIFPRWDMFVAWRVIEFFFLTVGEEIWLCRCQWNTNTRPSPPPAKKFNAVKLNGGGTR